ncbi:MAG: protein-export chaperone SecB [Deltaproteobacteria bacterium]|nr:protein-export chaperone SecB [Deltaproteobacteria bacterium]
MSFDNFKLLSISFATNKDFDKGKDVEINTEISSAYKFIKEKKCLSIKIRITLNQGNSPFYFDIESEGVFTFHTNPSKRIIENVTLINGPAIIFPYIRETIADLTRRAGFPPLHIQPVNFVELARQHKSTEVATQKKKTLKS